jgi:hypothetical protein
MIIGLWANAAHQGTTVGANMTGKAAEFDGNFLHNITHFMDMDFIGFGDNRITGDVLTSGNIHEGLYVEAVLKEAGLGMKDVVKSTVFLTDLNDFAAVNEVYAKHFVKPYPARSCVEISALPKGAKVECEVIAAKGE